MSELPEFVKNKIEYLSSRTGRGFDELVSMFRRIYEDIERDASLATSFATEEEKLAYCLRILHIRVLARPSMKEFYVIPFGIREARIRKNTGTISCRVYCLVKKEKSWEKTILMGRGMYADLWKDVQIYPFQFYKIRAIDRGWFLDAGPGTEFTEPIKPIDMDPIKFLTRQVGVKVFKLKDIYNNLSRMKDEKFVDELDIKGIYGIVMDYRVGTSPSGTKWAFYIISDDSIDVDMVDEQGRVIPSQITVWVPYTLVKYAPDSELFFYGTVRVSPDGVPFMRAIGIVPIHPKPIEGGFT